MVPTWQPKYPTQKTLSPAYAFQGRLGPWAWWENISKWGKMPQSVYSRSQGPQNMFVTQIITLFTLLCKQHIKHACTYVLHITAVCSEEEWQGV